MSELNIQETPTVVVPGSPNDPFSQNYVPTSEVISASPAAVPARGVTATPSADVPAAETPAATPVSGTALPTPVVEPNTSDEQKSAPDVDALVREAVEKTRREQQSATDKRVAALEKQIKDAQEASRKAEREAKLSGEFLSDEEKETLKNKWENEDTKLELDAYHNQLEDYYKSLQVETLSKEYSQYGVTRAELEAIDDADEMERFVQSRELEFHRSGKTVTAAVPTPAVVAATEPPAPAGATAPTHVGGTAPAPEPVKFTTERGWDAMAQNLKNLPESSVTVPN